MQLHDQRDQSLPRRHTKTATGQDENGVAEIGIILALGSPARTGLRNPLCASHTQYQYRPLRPIIRRPVRRRPQPDIVAEPVELREDSPPDPRGQPVDSRGGAQRPPVRNPGQPVGQLDQRNPAIPVASVGIDRPVGAWDRL